MSSAKPAKLGSPLLTSVTHSSVEISYDPPSNADSSKVLEYRIKYRQDGENVTWQTTITNRTSHTITGLDADTVYEFRVEARYEGGLWGTESDSARVKTKATADGECFAFFAETSIE